VIPVDAGQGMHQAGEGLVFFAAEIQAQPKMRSKVSLASLDHVNLINYNLYDLNRLYAIRTPAAGVPQ